MISNHETFYKMKNSVFHSALNPALFYRGNSHIVPIRNLTFSLLLENAKEEKFAQENHNLWCQKPAIFLGDIPYQLKFFL